LKAYVPVYLGFCYAQVFRQNLPQVLQNKLLRLLEIWTNWSSENAEKLKGFMSLHFVCHVPDNDFKGFNEYVALMDWFYQKFTNPEYTLFELIEEDNKVVARHEVITSYVGGWHDLPPSDRRIKETGINIFRFNEEGLLEELRGEMSDLGVYHQLRPLF
jgi:hypothetical protein